MLIVFIIIYLCSGSSDNTFIHCKQSTSAMYVQARRLCISEKVRSKSERKRNQKNYTKKKESCSARAETTLQEKNYYSTGISR